MTHHVGLVLYESSVHASVLDLPGCITGGRDQDEIEDMLPLTIAEHAGWLRDHGEDFRSDSTWDIAETVDARALSSTGGEFCFAADRLSLSSPELERAIARMDYARADLLAAVRHLPDAVLDWVPPAFAISSADPWEPEPRSIRRIAEHVLQLEAYYREGLHDGEAAGIFEKVADASSERARTIELLRSLNDDQRSRVYQPVRPSRSIADEWTVRKVLRRIISHERAHAAEVLQRRTWLLFGVPRSSSAPADAH